MLDGISSNEMSDAFNLSVGAINTQTGPRYKDDTVKLELEEKKVL
jgi:hypothetical protein